jgi:hypothetical protein
VKPNPVVADLPSDTDGWFADEAYETAKDVGDIASVTECMCA